MVDKSEENMEAGITRKEDEAIEDAKEEVRRER